jgi:hypothetical protein
MEPKLGAILSEPDYRDNVASGLAFGSIIKMGMSEKLQTEFPFAPYHQKQIPACVSHSIADIIKLWWFVKYGEVVDFSPRFLDILSSEPDIPLDGGRRPRTVLKVAKDFGICTTKTLPNNTDLSIAEYRDKSKITPEAYKEALKYKIPGYLRVPVSQQDARTAIYLYGATSTLFRIGSELWTPSWEEKDINPLRTPNQITSGHQMTQKGWKDGRMNTLRNEWGTEWCRKGEADFSYTDWMPFIYEQWVVAQIPKDTKAFLEKLPAAKDFHYTWERNMKQGDQSSDVSMAQFAFMILGLLGPVPPEELGIFGPKTARANLKYQTMKKISPVSPENIGPITRFNLNKDFA